MKNSASYTDQTMKELFLRVVRDGKERNPEDPAAYALSVMTACLSIVFVNLAERCQLEEMEEIRERLERVVNISLKLDDGELQ